jgi:hypothetical protein
MLLIERSLLPNWGGASEIDEGATAVTSDYARACAIDGYVGVVATGGGHALVLGDEPLSTTIHVPSQSGVAYVVRWVFGPDLRTVEGQIPAIVAHEDWTPELHIAWRDPSLVLIDAVETGEDHRATAPALTVPPGTYEISSTRWRPGPKTELVVHRLSRVKHLS